MEQNQPVLSEDATKVFIEYLKIKVLYLLEEMLFLLSVTPEEYFNTLQELTYKYLPSFISQEQFEEIESKINNPEDRIKAYIDIIAPPE